MHDVIKFISENLYKGRQCLAIFLDLAKAFDTVPVPILLEKLERLGVRGKQLDLFKSYMKNRLQSVKISNHRSSDLPVTYGVPQGSILGPTLFTIYINDLCQMKLISGKSICYADDTVLLFAEGDWKKTFEAAQNSFNTIQRWLCSNKLTLNAEKTKYLTFSICDVTQPGNAFSLLAHSCILKNPSSLTSCRCPLLERVEVVRYLGILLDKNLSFEHHIQHLKNRIRNLIYVFKNLRHVVQPYLLKQVYLALCESLLTYCISCWGGALKTHMVSLERAQRALLKVSTFKPFQYPTILLYNNCQLLTVRQLFVLNVIKKQHQSINYDPDKIKCKRRKDIVIQSSFKLNTKFIKIYFCFLGPYLYNKVNKIVHIYSMNRQE
ncbi:unnamed protein product [Parnassius mnemosyne]|uniref:Reverse transcriptase domain-containing protein n=1 Tax=Parnassius mnemosyne TaxID=213953 RepID=A0AAV1LMA9_9NEOP